LGGIFIVENKAGGLKTVSWYPIVWEELIYLRNKFWLHLVMYTFSPLIFLFAFGFGVGQRLQLMMPGGMSYLEFLVPGMVALALFNNGVNSVIIRMFYTRLFYNSFEAYQLAPMNSFFLWLGYTLSGALRSMLAAAIVLGVMFLTVPGLFLTWAFGLAVVLAAFCFGSLGVCVGLWLRSFDDHALANEFILVPMTFLSGTLIPVERLPGLLQQCVWFFPLTPVTELLRSTMTGRGWDSTLALLIGGWLMLFFLIGWLTIKRPGS
jgi:ABC-type multidrug transport system permease subunit